MGNKEKGESDVRAGVKKSLCPEHWYIRPLAELHEDGVKWMVLSVDLWFATQIPGVWEVVGTSVLCQQPLVLPGSRKHWSSSSCYLGVPMAGW